MVYNVLNGDSLAYSFPDAKIAGELIVTREALIEGDLTGNSLPDFWQTRAKYMNLAYNEYYNKTVKEFEKIITAPADTEFNLWFEYDLFCQVNLWFVLSLLHDLPLKKRVFAVYTSYLDKEDKDFWNGFGPANANQLITCYKHRILMTDDAIRLGRDLWSAYKTNNLRELTLLSKNQSPVFPYIQEVVQAHVDRFPANGEKGRPEKVLSDITKNISTDFHKVFTEFWKRESIYGFGDLQLKKIYDQVMLHQ